MLSSRTNPVLSEFRDTAGKVFHYREDLDWWVYCLSDPRSLVADNGYDWTLAHIAHARRVLSRLAALS